MMRREVDCSNEADVHLQTVLYGDHRSNPMIEELYRHLVNNQRFHEGACQVERGGGGIEIVVVVVVVVVVSSSSTSWKRRRRRVPLLSLYFSSYIMLAHSVE